MATGNGNWRDGVLLKIHPMSFCGRYCPDQALTHCLHPVPIQQVVCPLCSYVHIGQGG